MILSFRRIEKLNEGYKEQQANKYNVLARWDNPKTRAYYTQIDKMQLIAQNYENVLRWIAGYISPQLEAHNVESILFPIFSQYKWEQRKLDIVCDDVEFYEWKYKSFKIMFAKSTIPKSEPMKKIHRYINLKVFDKNTWRYKCSVEGQKYSIIQVFDDSNIDYFKVVKAETKCETKKY